MYSWGGALLLTHITQVRWGFEVGTIMVVLNDKRGGVDMATEYMMSKESEHFLGDI